MISRVGRSSIITRAGGAGLADPRPTLSATKTSDVGSVAGTVVVLGPGKLRVSLQSPTTVSRLPSAMALWEFPIKDLLGRALDDADDLDLGDILCMSVWASTAVAPTDVILACGLAAGAVDATDVGVAAAVQASAGNWLAHHTGATGTVWAAWTAATAASALTVGAQLQVIMGTAGTQTRTSAAGLDASGSPLGAANIGTAPGTNTSQADYDRAFVGLGWATGVGGTAQDIDIGVSALLLRPREVAGWRPFDIGAPTAAPATYSKILQITHSMGNGTVSDPTWSGVAVPANWDFFEITTNTDPFPVGTTPAVGPVPYLMAESDAFVRPATGTRWVVRCSTNGRAMGGTGFDVDVGNAIGAVAARGVDPDLIVLWMGANDAQTAAERLLYTGVHGLRRIIQMCRYEWPNAVIALLGETTSDVGSYPELATINTHKQALAAEHPYVYYVDAEGIGKADSIHPNVAGYAEMAARLFDVLP